MSQPPLAWAMYSAICPPGLDYETWMHMKHEQRHPRKRSQKKARLNKRRSNYYRKGGK